MERSVDNYIVFYHYNLFFLFFEDGSESISLSNIST